MNRVAQYIEAHKVAWTAQLALWEAQSVEREAYRVLNEQEQTKARQQLRYLEELAKRESRGVVL